MAKFSLKENNGIGVRDNSEKDNSLHFLDAVNYLLIVLIIGLLGYVLSKYVLTDQNKLVAVNELEALDTKVTSEELMFFKPKPFEVYAERIQARDLFQSLSDKLRPDTTALEKAIPALHKRIKLIGILLDEDSKAIVEDLKEKQTHFLSSTRLF